MPPTPRYLFAVLALTIVPALSIAAPPNVTLLYPAGAQRGTTTEVTASGTFERWPVSGWCDRPGVEIKAGKRKGELTVTVPADAEPGLAWLRLHDEQNGGNLRPFFVGTLPEVTEREPNDDFAAPQVLPGSCVVNGRLGKSGDVDAFALELRQGQTLVAALEANRTLKSPLDGVLQIVTADGFVLEQNDDHRGTDPQAVFTAPRDGRYLARVFAFPSTPDSSIRFAGADNFVYRLTLTTAGYADHADPLAVAGPADVAVVGWNVPPVARTVRVTPGAGAETANVAHPLLANAVPVRVEPHPCVVEQENSRDKPQKLDLPVTVTGRISRPGEVDAYEFTLKKREDLPITIDAQSLDSPLDPVLQAYNAAGAGMGEGRSVKLHADPALTVKPAQDGVYRLEVRDLHRDGGPRFVYRLRLGLPRPDFSVKLANDRFALVPGKTLEIPVTVEPGGGFKGEVTVTAEGLPEGVRAEAVKTTGKTATLKLTADRPAAGSFRVVGRAKGESELVRLARFPLADVGVATEHLWLTAGPSAQAVQPPAAPTKKRR